MAEHEGVVACTHCGLEVPPALVVAARDVQFCCHGCQTVHGVLQEHGLDTFYRVIDDADRQQARVTDRSYAELDNPSFAERYVRRLADGSVETELYLEGVHCAACVWLVEKLPQLDGGILEVRLDLGRQLAIVRWDPEQVKLSRAARLLDSLGYPVHPFRGASRRELRRREDRRLLVRIAVAGAVAGNVMLMAVAMYADVFGEMSAAQRLFFRWASLVTSAPAVFYSGSVFLRGAFAALRMRSLHMDLPIAIGILTGYGWGTYNTIRNQGDVYFDSVTALVFLLLVGRILQQRQQRGAADAAELLFSLTPSTARVVEEGLVVELPIEAVERGQRVEVRAGDTIPVDGVISEGQSRLNTALLSGESRPLAVAVGDAVHAGTVNLTARLVVEVGAAGEGTRVGQLMQRMEEYARRRPPIVQLTDSIAGYFVATTLSLAALTAMVWWGHGADAAIERAIALLIVTCPCALGLATPLAISVAVGRAARRGILIKGGDALERLARPGLMVLDKTGTVTAGHMVMTRWVGEPSLLAAVVALERHSAHPMARALVAAGPEGEALEVKDVSERQGAGISGEVAGRRIAVGTLSYLAVEAGDLADHLREALSAALAQAHTPVLVAADGEVVGLATFGDPLRSDARQTLEALTERGWRVELLSGDHPEIVRAVARELGLDAARAEGGATPERKMERVQRAAAQTAVVMVGDGVNDAAALSAATCGIAVHGGAEASLAAADVFLSKPGVGAVAELVDGARATMSVIRLNVGFSLAYNVAGAVLAMTGVISPLIAAILMPLSSVTVVMSSFRARTFAE